MKVPLTVLFQVACPYCERDYLLELDVVKLARLKRVAVCGQCGNQFSVSVRTQRSQASASHARRAVAIEEQATEGVPALGLAHEQARRQALGNQQTEPIVRSPSMAEGNGDAIRDGERPRPDLDTMTTEPDFPFSIEEARSQSRRAATRPDAKAPRARTSSGQQRTLGGVGAPPAARSVSQVDTHIIVEVGTMETGTAKPKKHLKTYRPHNLVTKPGLGIPFQLRSGSGGEAVSRAED